MEPAVTWVKEGGVAETGEKLAETAIEHGSHSMEATLMAASAAIAICGIMIGWWMYTRRRDIPEKLAKNWPAAYKAVLNKYYVDELYQWAVVENLFRLMRFCGRFDQIVIDGILVNGSAWLTVKVSALSGWIDNTS
jgi:NADH-quinone oxidoreductase subunit L